MEPMRYLPPGSMRRMRRLGWIEGAMVMLATVLTIGAAVVAAMPAELYRPAPATIHPTPDPAHKLEPAVDLPPCTDMAAKDCMSIPDAPGTADRRIPAPGGSLFAPWPYSLPAHVVPEPKTLLLIIGGLAAWLVAGAVAVGIAGFNKRDEEIHRRPPE